MKKLLIISLSIILLFSSCELTTSEVKPNIKLITVALNYKGSVISPLPNTLNDQSDLISQMKLMSEEAGYRFTTYTFREDNGAFYFNGNNAGATFSDEIDKLFTDTLAKDSKSNDITIFYYSGHGDTDGAMLVGLENLEQSTDATLIFQSIRNNKKNKLTIEKLHEYVTALNGKKLIILDSCYSGKVICDTDNAILQEEIINKGFAKLFSQEKIENKNTWYLSASRSDEESVEISSLGHGLFTYYLLQGLGFDTDNNIATNSSPLGSDNMISLNELFHYVDTYIEKEKLQHTQKGMSVLDLILFKWD